jgi:L-alanine-DL-glutamate epimerase-like enolase superfamily enzyme
MKNFAIGAGSVRPPATRRGFFRSAAGALAATFWAEGTLEAALQFTRTASKPSDLKITDLRIAALPGRPIVRLDTNQGISGYGEVRDGASKTYALMLKRVLIGENPCSVDKVFRKIKQFGFHARQAGGVCGVEMALWDLAGKAYGVPVYSMLGGKFRDTVRVYADTPMARDPQVFAERLKKRVTDGFTFLKMDVGIDVLRGIPGTVTAPLGSPGLSQGDNTVHMLTGIEITDKGIALMGEKVAQVREIVGMEIPLALDHFGHIGVNSSIRLGKAFQKYNPAWMEDFIPWQYTDLWKKITDAIDVPTITGEDIYLKEPFEVLCREHAVDIIHPDLASSGGILETHKIGDMAQAYGVPMAMHMAGSPVSAFANVHCAAATENVLVMENHSVDQPNWADIVDGVEKPVVNRGFIKVPDGPGLGFTINEEALKQQMREPGYFEPTPEWDPKGRVNDRLWS